MKRIRCFAYLGIILIPLVFGSTLAYGKGKPEGKPPGFEKGEKKGWGDSEAPPGWKKGKKNGWKGEAVPPGLKSD